MVEISGRLYDGKYHEFPAPVSPDEVIKCPRCGGTNMVFTVFEGKKVCFCASDICLQADSTATKASARLEYYRQLQKHQIMCEKKRAERDHCAPDFSWVIDPERTAIMNSYLDKKKC